MNEAPINPNLLPNPNDAFGDDDDDMPF